MNRYRTHFKMIFPLAAISLLSAAGSCHAGDEALLARLLEFATKQAEVLAALSEATDPVRVEPEVTPTLGAGGLSTGGLQTSAGLSSAARGLTTQEDWRRMFPLRTQR